MTDIVNMTPREIFKRALKDPKIDIDVIALSRVAQIEKIIKELTEGGYVSEWRHTLGEVEYEYHMHSAAFGETLKGLYDKGVRGGNGKLTNVYSRSDLEEIIHPQAVSNS